MIPERDAVLEPPATTVGGSDTVDPDLIGSGPEPISAASQPLHRVGPPGAAAIAARLLAILALLVAALSFVLAVENGQSLVDLISQNAVTPVCLGAALAVVGAIVVGQNPRNALAWLFCAQGQLQAWSAFGAQYAARRPDASPAGFAAFVGAYAWWPGLLMLLTLTIPLFPAGRPPSRRWRLLVWTGGIVTVLGSFAIVLTDQPMRDSFPGFRNPLALPAAESALSVAGNLTFFLAAALALIGIVGMVVRAARLTGPARGQAIWLLFSFAVGVVGQVLDDVNPAIPAVTWTLFAAAMGVAMIRGGLYDVDRVLNRGLLYTTITAVVAALFGLLAGVLAQLAGGAALGAVVAAIVVALAIDPVRRWVRNTVERAMFGDRRDPFRAVQALGERLSTTLAPDEALRAVAETVTAALHLPAASITLSGEGVPTVGVGEMPDATAEVPLVHAGSRVGTLTVGLQPGRRALDPEDQRLLTELARRAGAAAEEVRLTGELRRSRDEVVAARQAERHRIRRDLHDGLGPTLAGVALGIGAARSQVSDRATAELLERLRIEVRGALDDVRALVAQLRPAALADHGLESALGRHLAAFADRSNGALAVESQIRVPPLPPATETAVYRIALEALTNVTKHAGASRVWLDIRSSDGYLVMSIADDGVGLPDAMPGSGLGLSSMAERAGDLGGSCRFEARPGGGVVVTARIPLGAAS